MTMTPAQRPIFIAAVLTLAAVALIRAQSPAGRGQAGAATPTPPTAGHNLTRPNLPNPYRSVENIVTMPAGRTMGSTNAINVDAKGNIWVFERCGVNSCAESNVDPILQFDPSGKLLRSFGSATSSDPFIVTFDNPSRSPAS